MTKTAHSSNNSSSPPTLGGRLLFFLIIFAGRYTYAAVQNMFKSLQQNRMKRKGASRTGSPIFCHLPTPRAKALRLCAEGARHGPGPARSLLDERLPRLVGGLAHRARAGGGRAAAGVEVVDGHASSFLGKGRSRALRSGAGAMSRGRRMALAARSARERDATAQPLHRGREPPKANGRDGVGGEPSAGPHATHRFCHGKSGAKCALPLVVTSPTSEIVRRIGVKRPAPRGPCAEGRTSIPEGD